MRFPACSSKSTRLTGQVTALGYKCSKCNECSKKSNERTATPFNFLEVPTEIVLLAVLWRLRSKLSVRDIAEMFIDSDFSFTHDYRAAM